MEEELEQKSVIVVGASRGIGAAIAATFARRGHKVLGTHRGSGVAKGIAGFELDVRDVEHHSDLFAASTALHGKPDVLVVASGITRDAPLVRMPSKDIEEVMQVNLLAPMHLVKAAVPKMNRAGSIVLISSVSARIGHAGQANYTAAKAGLEGFVRTVAREYAHKLRINIVSPGPTATDMFDTSSPEAQATMKASTPMRRVGDPNEIADVAYWVSQSTFMTGATVPVSGGLMI